MQIEESWDLRRRNAAHNLLRRVASELEMGDVPIEIIGAVSGRSEVGRVWFCMSFRGAVEGEMVVAVAGMDAFNRAFKDHNGAGADMSIAALRAGFREALTVITADFGAAELGEFRPARAGELDRRLLENLIAARCGNLSLWFGLLCNDAKFEVAQLQTRLRRAEVTAANALRSARRSMANEEASWQQRSRVLERMSRRVRTPLGNVLGSVELLLDGERDPQRRALLEAIAESSETILRVVDDLDDLALIDAGEVLRDKTPFDLAQLVEQLVSRLQPAANARHIRLKARADQPLTVVGDGARLRQALLQLGRRMVDLTTRARIDVTLALRNQVDETVIADFELSDGGEILPPRPSAKDADINDGAPDLGMEVCRRLVEAMGGELRLDALPQGMLRYSMSVALPLARSESKTSALPNKSPRVEPPTAANDASGGIEGALRILLAEDDSVSRMVVTRMLKKIGFEVGLAENGAEAVRKCQEEPWDLVLMDLEMPLLDGLGATQKIRRDLRSKARVTPILALTAAPESDEKNRCMAAGMDGYLSKPVRLVEIQREIERWTGRGRKTAVHGRERAA